MARASQNGPEKALRSSSAGSLRSALRRIAELMDVATVSRSARATPHPTIRYRLRLCRDETLDVRMLLAKNLAGLTRCDDSPRNMTITRCAIRRTVTRSWVMNRKERASCCCSRCQKLQDLFGYQGIERGRTSSQMMNPVALPAPGRYTPSAAAPRTTDPEDAGRASRRGRQPRELQRTDRAPPLPQPEVKLHDEPRSGPPSAAIEAPSPAAWKMS